MAPIPRPKIGDHSLRTTHERLFSASASELYQAWTCNFDRWFAQAGTVEMIAEPGKPYFFYNRNDWGRHPHYGRFLELIDNELVEMTWLTGDGRKEGTEGAETILRIELSTEGGQTRLCLTHSGFPNRQSRDAHAENWPVALDILESSLEGRERTDEV